MGGAIRGGLYIWFLIWLWGATKRILGRDSVPSPISPKGARLDQAPCEQTTESAHLEKTQLQRVQLDEKRIERSSTEERSSIVVRQRTESMKLNWYWLTLCAISLAVLGVLFSSSWIEFSGGLLGREKGDVYAMILGYCLTANQLIAVIWLASAKYPIVRETWPFPSQIPIKSMGFRWMLGISLFQWLLLLPFYFFLN